MKKQDEIKLKIKEWFSEFTKEKIIDNKNFVKYQIIDSFKFLELIIFLEKFYNIEISKEFLQNNKNYTVQKISSEVLSKINE